MARTPSEEPQGLLHRPELLAPDEEAELLAELEGLRFDPIVMHGQAARRSARRHRDAPAFGTVIGVSLGGACRLRFQRGTKERRRVWELTLEPRSGYVPAGEARRSWQHSIPPTKELRHSITFRTLRQRQA